MTLCACVSFAPVRQHDAGTLEGACVAQVCDAAACGVFNDGCNSVLDCGQCVAPQVCGGGGVANRCGVGTALPQPVDVSVTVVFTSAAVDAGAAFSATIQLLAAASTTTAAASITTTLPPDFTSVTWSCTPGTGASLSPASGVGAPIFTASIAGSGGVTCEVSGSINASAASSMATLSVVATVTGDSNVANNAGSADITIIAAPPPPPPAPQITSIVNLSDTAAPDGGCNAAGSPAWQTTALEIRQGAGHVRARLSGLHLANATGATAALAAGIVDASHGSIPVTCIHPVDDTTLDVFLNVPHGVLRASGLTPSYTIALQGTGNTVSNAASAIAITPITVSIGAFIDATSSGVPAQPLRTLSYALARAGTNDTIDLLNPGGTGVYDSTTETFPACSGNRDGGGTCGTTVNVDNLTTLAIRAPANPAKIRGRSSDVMDCGVPPNNAALVVRGTALTVKNVTFANFGTRAIDFLATSAAQTLSLENVSLSKNCGNGVLAAGPTTLSLLGSAAPSISSNGPTRNGAGPGAGSPAVVLQHFGIGPPAQLSVNGAYTFDQNEEAIAVYGNVVANLAGSLTFTSNGTAIGADNTSADPSGITYLLKINGCGGNIVFNSNATAINTGVPTRIRAVEYFAPPANPNAVFMRFYGSSPVPTSLVEDASMTIVSPGNCAAPTRDRSGNAFSTLTTYPDGFLTLYRPSFTYEYSDGMFNPFCVSAETPAAGSYGRQSMTSGFNDLRWDMSGSAPGLVVVQAGIGSCTLPF